MNNIIWGFCMKHTDKEIETAFFEVQNVFPFGSEYLEGKLKRNIYIIKELEMRCPEGSKILSIGAGPCDLEAILSKLGYDVTAIDDLGDQWHILGQNRTRILDFAKSMNIKYILSVGESSKITNNYFDAVLLIDVLEHLHNSPRELLNYAISSLKPGGLLLIETPNSANLFNRLKVLMGKSNQVNIDFIYWNIGEYRSHFREYTESELKKILSYHNLLETKSKNINTISTAFTGNPLKGLMKYFYIRLSGIYPPFKDTLLISARKPIDWEPIKPQIKRFRKLYHHLEKYNIDRDNDDLILEKIEGKIIL